MIPMPARPPASRGARAVAAAPGSRLMEWHGDDPRLNQISTQWTLIFRAHGPAADEATAARAALLDRYGGAVRRYLLGALRDEEAAGELAQEFALRFLRGDFRRADPSKGRFRDYVGRSLHNLVVNYHRRRQGQPLALDELPEPGEPADGAADFSHAFREDWRRELLAKAWRRLAESSRRRGQPYEAVLRCRVVHPDANSAGLAELLAADLGRSVGADWVRKTLQRARDLFADYLLDEVEAYLDRPSLAELDGELNELGLREYCRPALARRDG